ncbi:MAG: alpha/beta fold hydrolase [Planctomycetaceae bacterium]|jgi:haloalkane dehalogenase|nr:alpha/beta fold hydrolase [Planctomycetaceae bacterium]
MKKNEQPVWRSLYPFESRYFNWDGLRYHYVDEMRPRNAKDRQTLLMVHGNPTWSFMFRNLITAFRDRYRCIAIDHIGCGLSDKPSEKEYPFSLERRIGDLSRFVEHLDLRNITLIAHDWGGAIGIGTAERFPDRFDRFVLMNTSAFSGECPLRIKVCKLPLFGRLAIQGLNLFSLGTMTMAAAKHIPKEVRAGYFAPYNTWANRTAVKRFVQDIPLTPGHPAFQTLQTIENALPMFRHKPVCLIWGMLDWCFSPKFLKRFIQFFPEAVVRRLDNAHHLVLEDTPEEVLSAIEQFLAGTEAIQPH